MGRKATNQTKTKQNPQLSEPEFYGDLVYKLKRIVGSSNFSAQFIKIISHYKKIGFNINVLQLAACFVANPITVGSFVLLQLHASGSNFIIFDCSDLNTYLLLRWSGPDVLAVVRPNKVYLLDIFWSGIQFNVLLESLSLLFIS